MRTGRFIKLCVVLTSTFIALGGGIVCVGLAEVIMPADWLFGDPSLKPSIVFDGSYNDAVDLEIILSIIGQCLLMGSVLLKRNRAKNLFEFAGLAALWVGFGYLAYAASSSTLESIFSGTLESAIPFFIASLVSVFRHLNPILLNRSE